MLPRLSRLLPHGSPVFGFSYVDDLVRNTHRPTVKSISSAIQPVLTEIEVPAKRGRKGVIMDSPRTPALLAQSEGANSADTLF